MVESVVGIFLTACLAAIGYFYASSINRIETRLSEVEQKYESLMQFLASERQKTKEFHSQRENLMTQRIDKLEGHIRDLVRAIENSRMDPFRKKKSSGEVCSYFRDSDTK